MKSASAHQAKKLIDTKSNPKTVLTTRARKQTKVNHVPVGIVDSESVLSKGRMWRMAAGYSVAYITNADVACELLGANRRQLDRLSMAYYTDRKGRTYAWQVAFRTDLWDEVARRLG